MNLYDYVKNKKRDFDVADKDYDVSVTVVYISKEETYYDKFVNTLIKKVAFTEETDNSPCVVADWSKLIRDNLIHFKDFSNKHWIKKYDEEEFIYQWIKELNFYIAGWISESLYHDLYELVSLLK